jgi:hypothetical protein
VTVTDDKTTVDCPAVTTAGNGDGYLDSGEQLTCSAEYTVLDADVTAGQVTNVASASADGTNSPDDSVTVLQLTAVPQPVPGLSALGVIMLTFLVFIVSMGVRYRRPES